jgi:hypothetical protein
MWDSTVRVERDQAVDADPEKVWALAGNLAALSAMPARFAFGVPVPVPATDRLCCLLVVSRSPHCAVLDVREEVPGQMIAWQTRNTQPAGKQVITLSVLPRSRGCTVRVAVSDVVRRTAKAQYKQFWRGHLETWIGRLRGIAEDRAPWPSTTIPADLREACSIRVPLEKPAQVSAAALINAPVAAVWEAVWSPESVRLIDPGHIAYAGHIPGTPEREAGEMQFAVRRHPGDRFTANVRVVQELTGQHQVVYQDLGPPYDEIVHVVTPAEGGTRLELACRWSASADRGGAYRGSADRSGGKAEDGVAKHMRDMADGYKAVIEAPATP